MTQARSGQHVIKYFVDNEEQTTTEKSLKVREILSNAGDDPATHYLVQIHGDHEIPYKDLDQTIEVHENEKFAAIFTGPTPVS